LEKVVGFYGLAAPVFATERQCAKEVEEAPLLWLLLRPRAAKERAGSAGGEIPHLHRACSSVEKAFRRESERKQLLARYLPVFWVLQTQIDPTHRPALRKSL